MEKNASSLRPGWQFWIDRGGTFTDLVARTPEGRLLTLKLLSENPRRYRDAAIAGIKTLLGLPLDAPLPEGMIEAVKMGTTVATNALLERKGAKVLLVVDRGFADVLVIGNQARPDLFALEIRRPAPLFARVVEIDGRIDAEGREITPLDEEEARRVFAAARAEGFEACAIVRMHAWRHPGHEERLATLAREAGFAHVAASHAVTPLLRIVPRGETTLVDAYVSPILRRYVAQVAEALGGSRLYFMQSNGSLIEAAQFHGKDSILSGPAGGINGAARTAAAAGFDRIIGFDMGGTSTDVALYDRGFERNFETEIAGARLRVPMLAINTVAAGGGSILHFDGSKLAVGPDSAGASPGPACYRNGGPLTITDANLLLGKIQPRHFPAIFGPEGNLPLDRETVEARFARLAEEVSQATGIAKRPEELAEGFIAIAVNNMANAIKQISVRKGLDPRAFTLVCFGGAGGQHACLVADALGMERVFIHPFAGVLSAYGMGLADQGVMRERAIERPLEPALMAELEAIAAELTAEGRAALLAQGAPAEGITAQVTLHLRYQGTDAALAVPFGSLEAMLAAFTAAHRRRFGFDTPERALIVEMISAEVIAPGAPVAEAELPPRGETPLAPIDRVRLFSGGAWHEVPVYDRDHLAAADRIEGPALIREANATTVIEPGWEAEVSPRNHLILRRRIARAAIRGEADELVRPDPVRLELFGNLFMHVAREAGIVLENTASSVNIKERLDFSCALFDAEGRLVANAPHVPVHLGAMGESVRTVLARRRGRLRPGDVIALNNPYQGGTHLPDVTVITPVFDEGGREIRYFVASRGHHADIGGLTPGSTPPRSKSLEEEGVVIDDFLLVSEGRFREAELRALLTGARYPARNPDLNVADIKAQIAANERGREALEAVIAEYGWPLVAAYMRHVMAHAEESVRRVIDRLSDGAFRYQMDDGRLLAVRLEVDRARRRLLIDFTGTGAEDREGNFNAPPAVTRAAVLYVFRCLVGADIPLNEGCLAPIEIRIPPGTFLSPSPGRAVVAGNTEVSQAVCNALFGAIGALACSQATMNNFLFGDDVYQYYETICGGSGAGPGFDGCDAVQTHMTNTRMTDPEVLELRYPVRLETFAIRRGSGGGGRFRGGDGALRRIRFLRPMTAVIVASRRRVAPFGLAGGGSGAAGAQWVERADGRCEALDYVAEARLEAGDAFVIATPGGGGYGAPSAAV
jgi:5-oxoprolinase (ATP-hydrolysing)